jgi:Gas vesicle protein
VTQGDRSPDVRLDSPPRRLGGPAPAQLADVLERVLDKGIVVAGDIQINLLDIELLTVKLRLLIASADKAREMGIDWWEGDAFLSRRARDRDGSALESRLRRLEERAGLPIEEERSER